MDSRIVELVLARSEHSAKVVHRAMETGFLVDQLILPGTSYIGRVTWVELSPSLQAALRDTAAGGIEILTGRAGQYLVARIVPRDPTVILGELDYGRESQVIWAKLTSGPTDARLLSLEVDVDTEDLEAICQSKLRLIDDKRAEARKAIAALPPESPVPRLVAAYAELVSLLSYDGLLAEATAVIQELVDRLPGATAMGDRTAADTMHLVVGTLELRRGEVDNCLKHHHAEMCLFPLSEAARHVEPEGAESAWGHLLRYLERHPDDLEARWLLNVAAMTLGLYPDRVPDRYRIGPAAFASSVDPGRFPNVATAAGVDDSNNAGGSVTDDFDGDGLLDIAVSSRDPCERIRLYRNRGDGGFEEIGVAAGLGGQLGGLNLVQTDYDNDGRPDLFVKRGGWETAMRNSLLRNVRTENGVPIFEDVTDRSGLGGPAHRTQSAAWADYDRDGHLDVFLSHEFSFSQLFRNRGDGTFEDTTSGAGMRFRSLTKAATWGDVDGDLDPDLYVSNFGDRNLLFLNRGDGRFEEVGRQRGVDGPTYSFATWFWDYDNDGWEDLLVAGYLVSVEAAVREYLGEAPRDETLRIYRNRGDGTFEDTTTALGMNRVIATMGANFGDLNNDGYLDFYLGTGAPSYGMIVPNRLFLNQRGRSFVDVTTATGTGHLQKGHGISFADLDNDGDEDIFANMGGAFPGDKYPNALFANPGHGNDWLAIELVGKRSNRAAIGAKIRVHLRNANGETRRYRSVTSGGSFGASPLMQHIGLGREATIREIEILWPILVADGERSERTSRQLLVDVPVNSFVLVTEGEEGFELRPRPRFELESPARGHGAHGSTSP